MRAPHFDAGVQPPRVQTMSDRIDFSAFADEGRENRVIARAMARLPDRMARPEDLVSAILAAAPVAVTAAALVASLVSIATRQTRADDPVRDALLHPTAAEFERLGPTPAPGRLLAVLEAL